MQYSDTKGMKKIRIKRKKEKTPVKVKERMDKVSGGARSKKNVDRLPDGRFAKGNQMYGSRRGCPNKFTTLKQAFINVFERLGGEDALIEFAELHPDYRRDFFNWIARMLPREVNIGSVDEVKPNELEALTEEELDEMIESAKNER